MAIVSVSVLHLNEIKTAADQTNKKWRYKVQNWTINARGEQATNPNRHQYGVSLNLNQNQPIQQNVSKGDLQQQQSQQQQQQQTSSRIADNLCHHQNRNKQTKKHQIGGTVESRNCHAAFCCVFPKFFVWLGISKQAIFLQLPWLAVVKLRSCYGFSWPTTMMGCGAMNE